MRIQELSIRGAFLLKPDLIEDERGHFFREFCKEELSKQGIYLDDIVQINRSFNKSKGTFRGLHYQLPPFSEEKVITCIQGSVIDVVVDLRKRSSTFLHHELVDLSSQNKVSVLIPKGCAHGFVTIMDNSELLYLHTNYYNPQFESACSILDPILNIKLPIDIEHMSERDKCHDFIKNDFKGIEL